MNENGHPYQGFSKKLIMGLTLVMLMAQLTACGFKFPTAVDLPKPMRKINIKGASTELRSAFATVIKRANGELVPEKQADIVVDILEEDLEQRVVSLNSSGNSTEFELNYYVIYELHDSENNILVPEQSLEIIKDFFNNQVDVIAKDVEGNIIRGEIYQQAVQQIIDRSRFELKKIFPEK